MARPEVTGRGPRKKRRPLGPPTYAFTIQEFCDAHRISRAQYYELKKLGLGPREARALDKIIITRESATEWRAARTEAERGDVA
jgi:hypothetical protein